MERRGIAKIRMYGKKEVELMQWRDWMEGDG